WKLTIPAAEPRGIKPISWHFVPPEFLNAKSTTQYNPGASSEEFFSIKPHPWRKVKHKTLAGFRKWTKLTYIYERLKQFKDTSKTP
ncbi:MAG TPA: hypothetical protein VJ417_13465, partial [Candidatus Glassbacteria bacterium]|nr:hypothetical protein [Candidatus Glassbacteria bacterium]